MFKGCCFVKFRYRDDAIDAQSGLSSYDWQVEWYYFQLDQQTDRTICRATNRESRTSLSVERSSIFVGHLSRTIDESQLFEKFSQFGTITTMSLVRRGNFNTTSSIISNYRGSILDINLYASEHAYGISNFSFISFQSEKSASLAIQQMNNTVSLVHIRKHSSFNSLLNRQEWEGHWIQVAYRQIVHNTSSNTAVPDTSSQRGGGAHPAQICDSSAATGIATVSDNQSEYSSFSRYQKRVPIANRSKYM